MQPEQTVAEMANEVLIRQAKARADRNGEPIEAAMSAVVGTESGRQLVTLRDGPHGGEGVEEWQVGIAQERVREWAGAVGGRRRGGPRAPHSWLTGRPLGNPAWTEFREGPFHAPG